ncbi:DUF1801 domain-containing protein [Maribacter cobaltidurans]|uniref:YdhG-like domain-containing protein n=1 Tax=Maribacter cobaltidurans TaxID=1178778 RepID=A0A223V506_9FLAO|nr:DUF1801 domain-containing protein [Maribacter cobaltidurans]ASV30220.1 hypothetical protein CJ263_08305 [Maribacter cobaltidurans]GGD76744.1 hypothetical protein GCM10011412_13150 [Maribacter cobaltidurans]
MGARVDKYISKQKSWSREITHIRNLLLDCGLEETLKWRQPCYTFKGKNILIIGSFKDFCCLSFFKGVLLKDAEGILKQQGENTQSARIVPFTNMSEIMRLKPIIKAYVFEAIEIEKSGLKVEYRQPNEMGFPEELERAFQKDADFEFAFKNLTPGRQKGYLLFISGAKQSATRVSRIEKHRSRIMAGKGIHDCVCGHSQKMPSCDGSHKYI